MAFIMNSDFSITMYQGDTGQIILNGLPTDKDYTVYFAIQNSLREPIGDEVSVEARKNDSVVIELSGILTDLLVVPEESKKETYYYGLKICTSDGKVEDTLILGDGGIGELNPIYVYPRKVKGFETGNYNPPQEGVNEASSLDDRTTPPVEKEI